MFEIKLCPHFKEREKCADCQTVYKAGFGTQWAERACSDCDQYEVRSRMIEKADGRVICRPCQKAIDDKAREQAQSNLFVQQESLF